jgi:hypothetical protein
MKLLAGGCSLIYGSELPDTLDNGSYSQLTYTALLAQHHNLDYQCVALPGVGNDTIARQVVEHIDSQMTALVIVNWSYKDRAEFHYNDIGWQSLQYPNTEYASRINQLAKPFYSDVTDTYLWYKHLQEIVCLQTILNDKKIPFIFSSADYQFFNQENVIHSKAHKELYELIDFTHWFFWKNPENGNHTSFINWAKKYNYPLGPLLHPLELAHYQTFELLKLRTDTIL